MDDARKRSLLERLKTEFSEIAAQLTIRDAEQTPILSFLVPLRDDGTGLIFFELFFQDYGENYTLLDAVVTILPQMGDRRGELEKLLPHFNGSAIIGTYGIYAEGDQLFLRHTLSFEKESDDDIVEVAFRTLFLICDEITAKYDVLCAVAAGEPAPAGS